MAAERLRNAISALKIVYNRKTISCTLSFGVASGLPDQEVSKDGFIRMADKALSLAKAHGKDQCYVVKG
jgi:PleD family two-component response regulator